MQVIILPFTYEEPAFIKEVLPINEIIFVQLTPKSR